MPLPRLPVILLLPLLLARPSLGEDQPFRAYVSNELSGDITVIDGHTFDVLQTIPAGNRR